ncbi:MAG TPA: SIMPL domain-containing protein [Clostridia bacterium]|nr:SIMPL domain-containing protein [Clostridia bacterium]
MRKLVIVVAVLLTSLAAWAQQPTFAPRPDTVYVGADGKFEAAPDTALIQFNIAAQDPELKPAYDHASNAAEQVREVLRANGLDPRQAEVGSFQVQPVYDWRNGAKRKLVGYRVSSAISFKLKDFAKIGTIANKFAEMDVTENQSINYTLENIDAAKTRAVDDAFQKAKANALTVAKAGGRVLGELSYASVDTYEPVPVVMAKMETMRAGMAQQDMAAPTEGFSPQKITVTAHVNALFALK